MKLNTTTCAAALLAVLATPAFAQSDDRPIMDEVVTTAQHLQADVVNALKSPTPIIDVPQSLSIITADQITNQGFDSVADIINYIPGVTNSQGEGHRDAVVFRGIRSTADFFVDGVRDDVQYYRGLYNLEQVEVLRGPNALLFGRGGTGGLINRVTKKGEVREQFAGYKTAVDTFGAFSVEFDGNFSTNDTSAFRINGMYESLNTHRDFYDGDRFAVNPTARFKLGPTTTLDIAYEYVDNQRFIDRGIPTGADGRPVEALKDITFGDPELNTAEFEAHILRANLTKNFSGSLKGVFNVTYGDYDKLYQNLYASGYDPVTNIVTLDGYVDTTQRKSLNFSGNLINEFTTASIGHTIVGGVEYRETSNDNDRYNTFFDQTQDDNETFFAVRPLSIVNGIGTNAAGNRTVNDFSVSLNDDTEADVTVFSAFVQDEIAVTENFDVVLGARFDSFDITSVDTKVNPNVTLSRKDEEITPRLGVVYKPRENVSIYGSFSQSFLPRSGGQFASVSSTSALLEPDVFENLEGGVKWDIRPGLSFTAAYFQNEQTIDAAPDGAPQDLERRGLEVDGFELQLEGQVLDRMYVKAGYANLSGKTDDGKELPRELPENTFSVWTNYKVSDTFGLGLGITHQSKAFINDFDLPVQGQAGSNPATHPTLPAFTRLDAAAYYDVSDTLRIQVNIENLTDELYFPTSHSTHQASVGAPLNARFTVSGRF